jgi:hypothetical protein
MVGSVVIVFVFSFVFEAEPSQHDFPPELRINSCVVEAL